MRKYFLAEKAYIYPSSNAKDGGSTNSEENLAKITDKFTTKNFIVRNKNVPLEEDTSLSLGINDDGDLELTSGACVINGYYIEIQDSIFTLDSLLPKNTEGNTIYPSVDTQYYLKINLHFDNAGHVRGDSGTAVQEFDTCYGLSLEMEDVNESTPSAFPHLLLGTVVVTGTAGGRTASFNTISMSSSRFSFIDSSSILTSDNRSIEDSVELSLRKLSTLNYWNDPKDAEDPEANPDTSLYLESGKIMFKPGKTVDAYNLLDRLQFAPRYGTTLAGTRGTQTETNNGSSAPLPGVNPYYIARADHDHDSRYIITQEGITDHEQVQRIGTSLYVNGDLEVVLNIIANNIKSSSILTSDVKTTSLEVSNEATVKTLNINNTLNIDAKGNLTTTGTITGSKVYNAVWNDYAELYKKDDPSKNYEPGTVICKVPGKDTYTESSYKERNLVVGVVSNSYGMLLGGDEGKTEEENLKNYIPIALSGRVYVKVCRDAVIEEGDLLYPSAVQGRATALPSTSRNLERGTIIGKALESSDGTKDKILMQVMLG